MTQFARSAVRCLLVMVLVAGAALVPLAPRSAAAQTAQPPQIKAAAGVLVDAKSGAVLWARKAHRPRRVASTTKMLTALVAVKAFDKGQKLTVPEEAVAVEGSRIGVETGMKIKRNELLVALLLASGNDVAETFARNHPKGREGFLKAMQNTCALLGCTDSTWRDPSGLDAPGHKVSAADLAIVARALLQQPLLAKIVASPTLPFTWPDGRVQILSNHNKMVRYEGDPGTIGVKTGYTSKSGHTLVSAQRRDGRALIAVVLDTPDHYAQVRKLFDYGFSIPVPEDAELLGVTAEEIERAAVEPEEPSVALEPTEAGTWSLGSFPMVIGVLAVVLLSGGAVVIVVSRRARRHP